MTLPARWSREYQELMAKRKGPCCPFACPSCCTWTDTAVSDREAEESVGTSRGECLVTNNLKSPNPKAKEHVEEAHLMWAEAGSWLEQIDALLKEQETSA